MRPECVITGADLVVFGEGKAVHGDLHTMGDVYIFNAVLDGGGDIAWKHGITAADFIETDCKVVGVNSSHYFERRGVIVFSKTSATLNDAAFQYLNK